MCLGYYSKNTVRVSGNLRLEANLRIYAGDYDFSLDRLWEIGTEEWSLDLTRNSFWWWVECQPQTIQMIWWGRKLKTKCRLDAEKLRRWADEMGDIREIQLCCPVGPIITAVFCSFISSAALYFLASFLEIKPKAESFRSFSAYREGYLHLKRKVLFFLFNHRMP